MEQIAASIARYILTAAGDNITPYYNDLQEGFKVPSVFFPEFEVGTSREDFDIYQMWLDWDESYEYDDLSNKSEKMQTYDISLNFKKEV